MTNFFHVIKDPVHGTMQFTTDEDSWVKPFIDSPNFQRLRHIKQLGLGDYIFPGSVHTRFNHCLGCCYIAGQISHKIGLSDCDRQLVMIAALLHDIGHGPFSHAFEDLFHNRKIRHEDWTPYFLSDYCQDDFFTQYNQKNKKYPLDQEKFKIIAGMIMHQSTPKNVLADIVSSQLDADRLDYLLRDNHFCGVRYGEFDFRWMLHCMTIVDDNGTKRLGITHKGIGAVEHYLMARRLMMRNIYHSHKKLAFETWLVQMLASLATNLKQHPQLSNTRLGRFLSAVNAFNENPTDKKQFLETNYLSYKDLCDYDIFSAIKMLAAEQTCSVVTELAKRLQYRIMPKTIHLDHEALPTIEKELAQFLEDYPAIQSWQMMINETPHRSYSDEEDPILVVNEQGAIHPIGHFSFMLNAMANKYEHTGFLCIDPFVLNDKRVKQFIQKLQVQGV